MVLNPPIDICSYSFKSANSISRIGSTSRLKDYLLDFFCFIVSFYNSFYSYFTFSFSFLYCDSTSTILPNALLSLNWGLVSSSHEGVYASTTIYWTALHSFDAEAPVKGFLYIKWSVFIKQGFELFHEGIALHDKSLSKLLFTCRWDS